MIARNHALTVSMRELIDAAVAEKDALIAKTGHRALPGAVALVRRLARRAKLAVVSGASRKEVRDALTGIGVRELFPIIVGRRGLRARQAVARAVSRRAGAARRRRRGGRSCSRTRRPGILAARAAGAAGDRRAGRQLRRLRPVAGRRRRRHARRGDRRALRASRRLTPRLTGERSSTRVVKLSVVRSPSTRGHDLRGRARATACRTRRAWSRPTTRSRLIDALSETGPAGHRDHQLRQPEVDPAAGRRRARCRARIARKPGVVYSALVPNRQGLDAALAAGMKRGRGLPVGVGDAQQEERQQDDRRDAGGVRGDRAARAGRRAARARLRLDGLRLPLRGRGRSRQGGRALPRAARRSAATRSRSATPSASPTRARCATCSARVLAEIPAPEVAVHFHDTRGTALANILVGGRDGHHHRRRGARRPGRLPVRAGRLRQPRRPRTSSTCCTAWASRPASISTSWSTARRLASTFVGHEMPSKYYRAAIGARSRSAG